MGDWFMKHTATGRNSYPARSGLLLKRLHQNGLCGVSHVIVDEVHERDLDNAARRDLARPGTTRHDPATPVERLFWSQTPQIQRGPQRAERSERSERAEAARSRQDVLLGLLRSALVVHRGLKARAKWMDLNAERI